MELVRNASDNSKRSDCLGDLSKEERIKLKYVISDNLVNFFRIVTNDELLFNAAVNLQNP
jgi:hypothetical protein